MERQDPQKLAMSLQDQLTQSKALKADRDAFIKNLQEQNEKAQREINARNKEIDYLQEAQQIEQRIIALLNYLSQKPDDDRQALLKVERETQAIILRTLEEHCKSTR
jgi:hypothetical protein